MASSLNRGPGSVGMPNGGINMLIPLAFDLGWTGLDEVFNDYPPPVPQPPAGSAASAAAAITQAMGPFAIVSSNVPLTNSASGQIFPTNYKRVILVLQNNSPTGGAVMYVNLGQNAGRTTLTLQPQQGVLFDYNCPQDAVYVAWSAAGGLGAAMQSYKSLIPGDVIGGTPQTMHLNYEAA
jgi:hypothetical protein